MKTIDWHRIEQLFTGARALPERRRGRWLRRRCRGDTDLRSEVDALLQHDQRAIGFLDTPPTVGTDDDATFPEIDGYELIAVLGEGGMGTVYLAEQIEPIRRAVALKLIKRGMDSADIVARFDAERRALARLNHPHIALVYAAGVTAAGRPYFAMELVDGVAITAHCRRVDADLEQRLIWFEQVCEAVQHAHHKGIVHRDLKASNILITSVDGRPVPKIIDFGLAKVIEANAPASSMHTRHGLILGTPEYMSPEQARSDGADVDTRTDIYALGVLLYELLSGYLPFEPATLRSVPGHEALRRIQEDEPKRPSERLRIAGATTGARRLRGDLDRITMKALAKDRELRYGTAAELARDVGRFRAGDPVDVAGPGAWYRVRKLAVKHRAAVGVGVVVMLALLAALLISLRATHDAQIARGQAQERYEAVVRLSDVVLVEELQRLERDLWPALPALVRPASEWLDRARALLTRLPAHRAALAALRQRALPRTGEQAAIGRATHPQAERVRSVLQERDFIDALIAAGDVTVGELERLRARAAQLNGEADALVEQIERQRPWRFPSAQDQWQHDVLAGLVSRLDAFATPDQGLLATVQRRCEFATTIAARSTEGPAAAAAWRQAIADIAALPIYGGLRLTPQVGLLPLRRDPSSGLWEFWHMASGTQPQLAPALDRWCLDGDTGIVLVLVPGGTAAMGAVQTADGASGKAYVDPFTDDTTAPLHDVELSPFFVSKYEMTQGQWLRIAGDNPSQYGTTTRILGRVHDLTHPVEQVSWQDCQATLRQLGLQLPTEAQWERAVRGGTTTVWWTGDARSTLRGKANLGDASAVQARGRLAGVEPDFDDGHACHAPAGTFGPNPFGLFETLGNVAEWCRDGAGPYGRQPRPGDGEHPWPLVDSKCIRGGHYTNDALCARSAARAANSLGYSSSFVGVRPARAVER